MAVMRTLPLCIEPGVRSSSQWLPLALAMVSAVRSLSIARTAQWWCECPLPSSPSST